MTKRILVIGSSGQVAQALRHVNFGADAIVECAGRDRIDLGLGAAIIPAVKACRPDLIINAAAYTAVDKAESEPDPAHAINCDGPKALGQAARELGASLIHISTDYVFDGTKTGPYGEDDPTGPQSVYGRTKLAGEEAVRAACDRHVIVRTSWVFSATGSNFVKTMLRLGAERDEVGVVDDQTGCPTYADDLAAWIGVIGQRLLSGQGEFGTFHAAGRDACTWADFAQAIFEGAAQRGARVPKTLRRIGTKDYPTPARRPTNSHLSTQRLSHAYSITPRSWRAASADCLDRLILKENQ